MDDMFWKKKQENSEPQREKKWSYVVGMNHHQDEIKMLFERLSFEGLEENADFKLSKKKFDEEFGEDEKVFNYEEEYLKCHLEHEPTNPHDRNAVQVYVSTDGQEWFFVGYIPKVDSAHVCSLVGNTQFYAIWHGVKYKQLHCDEIIQDTLQCFDVYWWE